MPNRTPLKLNRRPRLLSCSCCGGETRGRQFDNQDTGSGLCDVCAVWLVDVKDYSEDYMRRTYGREGFHYLLTGKKED